MRRIVRRAAGGSAAGGGGEAPLSNAMAERATWILALGGPAGPGIGWCDGCSTRVYTWDDALRHADVCAAAARGGAGAEGA